MIALIVVALGAVVAAAGTGVLAARSTRVPRSYFVAWTIALFGLAIGLGAATLGYLAGFGGLIFRAMELGASMLAPLSLCLAMAEAAGRSLPARFAMRLALSGITVIALVILGTDPLNPNVTFTTKWPDPSVVYQLAPLTVLGLIAIFTAVTALATFAIALTRSSRQQLPKAQTRPTVLTAVASFVVVLPGLSWLADKGIGVSLPFGSSGLFALCSTVSAALIWYAARVAGERDLRAQPESARRRRSDDDWDDEPDDDSAYRRPASSHAAGEFDDYRRRYDEPDTGLPYPGLAELAADPVDPLYPGAYGRPGDDGRYADDSGQYDGVAGYGPDSVQFGRPANYPDDSLQFRAPDQYPDDSLQFGQPPVYPDDSLQFSQPDQFPDDSVQFGQPGPFVDDPPHFGGRPDRATGWDDFGDQPGTDDSRGELFGQITIYTLIEGRADEFDRLTEWVVGQVRAKEPDTLVYIVHAVPTAPMQRILYEVYRDRVAHEEHLSRGYVQTYADEQRPFVLATNVIELGLQQAKVSPLPSISAISDLLSESGIDLTGITRSAQPGGGQTVPPGPGYQRSIGAGPASSGFAHQHPDEPQYSQPRYSQPGYDQPGYDRSGYDRSGYDRAGYDRAGYDQVGDAEAEFDQPEYEPPYPGGWAEIRRDDPKY